MISLRYRSDIDGLRAVAVLGVVIYHAFPQNLPGGFCGVDIFFVLSGYLISGILYKGHHAGNFSYKEFYARRIRRLFPALITVLLLTLAYGWVVLLSDEFEQMGKHVVAGTVFAQNFVFWRESGYFDTAANLKPLLHLWSLAVEEQFYIVFPLLMLVFWKRPKALFPVMIVLFIASLIGNLMMSYQAPATDFFLTPYRAWEFLGGAILAWWHYEKGHEEEKTRGWMSIVGAILLAVGFLAVHKGDPYPGWRALMPVAGTLLLIAAGGGSWINRTVLSHPAVVWIGLISYPLYLFHWPLLSFLHIVKGEKPGNVYLAGVLLLSLMLAVVTYYFIEKRLRHSKALSVLPSLVAIFLITGLLGAAVWTGWIKTSSSSRGFEEVSSAARDREVPMGLKSLPTAPHCTLLSTEEGGKETLYIGDSNMEQYQPRICSLLSAHPNGARGAMFFTAGGIPPIPGVEEPTHPSTKTFCPELYRLLDLHPEVDKVVIAANWVWYCSLPVYPYTIGGMAFPQAQAQKKALAALGEMVDRIRASGKRVYFVMNIPVDPALDPKSGISRGWGGPRLKPLSSLDSREFFRLHGEFLKKLKETVSSHGSVVIDPMDFFLRGGCFLRTDVRSGPVYRDSCHLRSSYVRDRIEYLDQTVAD